ncbi:ImmA/IrrE family metallo-endopeptidase [Niallia circulans]
MQQINTNTDRWEEKANLVLSHFNYHQPDEIDIYDICWRYGVIIKPLDAHYFGSSVDYESIKHLKSYSIPKSVGKRGTIFIQPELDPIEKRMLLTEEFCHCYSHYSSQLIDDEYMRSKQEHQAKRMSAYLLMPSHFLKQLHLTAISEPLLISDIADHFLVSEEFAHYRLNLIFQHRVDGFMQLKNRLGTLELFDINDERKLI